MRSLASLALIAAAACARPSGPTTAPAVPAVPAHQAVVTTEPQQAWAGVRFDPASTRIVMVVRDGPAALGGIQPGDVVVSLDGEPATSADQLVNKIRGHAVGDRVQLVVERGGAQVTVAFVLGARPDMVDLAKHQLEGTPAPRFAPVRLAGPHSASLDDLRGNVVVLDFWATWCGPCQITMPTLERWQATYGARGLRVVGVSAEELADITASLVDHKLGYTIAHDVDAQASAAYLVSGVPTLVVIDRAGIVRLVHVGADDLGEAEAVIRGLL
jgi:thiol-disulfide isomerase/thioredoxin